MTSKGVGSLYKEFGIEKIKETYKSTILNYKKEIERVQNELWERINNLLDEDKIDKDKINDIKSKIEYLEKADNTLTDYFERIEKAKEEEGLLFIVKSLVHEIEEILRCVEGKVKK